MFERGKVEMGKPLALIDSIDPLCVIFEFDRWHGPADPALETRVFCDPTNNVAQHRFSVSKETFVH